MCSFARKSIDLLDRLFCINEPKKTHSQNNFKYFYIPENLIPFISNSFYHICFQNNITSLIQFLSAITIRLTFVIKSFPFTELLPLNFQVNFVSTLTLTFSFFQFILLFYISAYLIVTYILCILFTLLD